MKKLKLLKNNSFRLEKLLDSFQVGFNVGFSNTSEITDYRILTYDLVWGHSSGNIKKWYLLDELKFSHGGPNRAIYQIRNLDKNVTLLTNEELRDLRLELLLQES
jgi:hypothetical protein